MIPTFSAADYGRPWEFATRGKGEGLADYDRGAAVLGQPFGPPPWITWIARYADGAVTLSHEDGSNPLVLLTHASVSRIAFTFDQNMSPVLAYEAEGLAYLRREVPGIGTVTTDLGAVSGVCLTLDDGRPEAIPDSDVILGYMRDGNLYCRVQRENYAERLLKTAPGGVLRALGVCVGPRLQWRLAY